MGEAVENIARFDESEFHGGSTVNGQVNDTCQDSEVQPREDYISVGELAKEEEPPVALPSVARVSGDNNEPGESEEQATTGTNGLRGAQQSGGSSGYTRRPKSREKTEDGIRTYLDAIGEKDLLNKDDERRLAQLIEKGRLASTRLQDSEDTLSAKQKRVLTADIKAGQDAKEEFIHKNLRLVVSIAKRYIKSGVAMDDLVQEGNLGLIHAVDKFDWQKGFKFSTYATWWIRQAIGRGIRRMGRSIQLTQYEHDAVEDFHRAFSDLVSELGREPTDDEVIDRLSIDEKVLSRYRMNALAIISLQEPIGNDDSQSERGDLVAGDGEEVFGVLVDELALPDIMRAAFDAFDENNDQHMLYRRALMLRYGIDKASAGPRSIAEVAKIMGVTTQTVNAYVNKGMYIMRHAVVPPEVDIKKLKAPIIRVVVNKSA